MYGQVLAPKFGGAILFTRKTSEETGFSVITPCKEYKIIDWEKFWNAVDEHVLEKIEEAKINKTYLDEKLIAAEILQCMNGNFISKDYYKLALSPKYARLVFELNKYILGVFYREGLITKQEGQRRVAAILKNLNTRAL